MFRAAILIVTLLIAPAQAQMMMLGVGSGNDNPSTYSGPGDVVASAFWWGGFRAYSKASALAHANAFQVCTALDASCEVETNAAAGNVTLGAVATACGVGACTVKTVYDQSGNGNDAAQATIANRAVFTKSCKNGQPCMTCPGSASAGYLTGAVASHAAPITFYNIVERTGAFTTVQSSLDTFLTGGKAGIGFNSAANQMYAYAGGASSGIVAAADSQFHSLVVMFNGASTIMYIDGVSNAAPSVGGAGQGSPIALCQRADVVQPMTGPWVEGGIWTSGFNATQAGNMYTNQTGFWGTLP